MNVSDNAMTILQKRYLWPGETPEGMLRRVADTVGAKETREVRHAFFDMMDNLEFLPNSPTLMNAGKPDGQLAACFVLPVEDSMESIMAAATAQAMVFKSGGGCIGGESTIITDKGPIDIKTFCEKQMQHRVLSFDASTGDTSYKSVSAHHITPLPAARIYEVKMSGGCSIRASDWHPFFVWNGTNIEERRADHLKKGDVVIGSTKMAELTAPDWQAWLIGLILSDGAFDFTGGSYRYRRLRICKGNEAVIARAAEVLGCNYSLSSNSAYCAPVWELAVSGKRAEKIFESFGAEDVRCSNKRIPEWVWDSGASSMLHLLIGLLDGDGWYCNNKHRFCYDTISEELAKDVMALCGYLGIPSSMRKRIPRRHNEQPIYEISIRTNASLLEAADRLSTRHAGHLPGYKKFAIPVSLEYDKRLKEHYGVSFWKADWWKNGIPMDRGKINIRRWHHDGLMPINSAAMLLRKIGESELAAALDSAHVVKSVSVSEKDDTLYDLTVPGTQTYVAGVNGFCVVHNTGFDFSKLRPEGSPIRNSIGTASGPVSFMELFDKVTDVVKAGGGRRGANMGILRCDHPDIEKFVLAKSEQGNLSNFNISVMATDEWMANPGPLFDLIVEQAWKRGDPGLLFYDRINEGNTTPWLGDLTATNPCVTGDTLILTDTGYQRIDELVNKRVNVWNGDEWSEVVPAITGENQPIMEISFSDGSTLKCTPYHKFLVQEGFSRDGKVFEAKAEELRPGMRIAKFKFPVIPGVSSGMSESEAYINGFYSGDGYWDKAKKQHVIFVYGKKRSLTKYLCENARRIGVSTGNRDVLVADPDVMHEKFWVPGTECSVSERLAWLAGLIDSDGSKNSIDCSVNITSTNHDFLMKVKRLINTLGENATIAKTHDAQTKSMPDGHGGLKEYDCQACYRLLINASTIERLKHLGLNLRRVDVHHAIDRDASRFIKVTGVRLLELRERYVYCFNEPKRHMGIFNGVLTFQCGESPLYPYEACNLGSINMAAFVRDGGSIDYKRLEEVVRLAVRFLDDVIDVNAYSLPEIEKAAKRTRKIGLGIMGWADTLIMMGIPYGSDRSIELAHKVWGFVDETAYDESRLLAAARGAYPAFQGAEPIRNATRTCIAPTGTISLIADVSSGIEPVFAFEHTRMAFSGEAALKVVHPLMERAKREGWYDPEVFVDAHHVPYRRQIEMQAAFQEHTDLAVSKTINLPSSATVDDVRDAYLTAWKAGCKGITVYRDGCLDGQVLVAGDKPKKSDEATRRLPHSRPEGVISGKTSKMPTSFGNLYVTLNYLDNGRPIEAFSTVGKSGADMESCTEAIGRLMSLALRYEIPIGEIIDQLKGISGAQPVWDHNGKSVLSIPDGIARCLEELTGDVRTVKSGELCPECGGMTERGEGCVKCPSCGWSRC